MANPSKLMTIEELEEEIATKERELKGLKHI